MRTSCAWVCNVAAWALLAVAPAASAADLSVTLEDIPGIRMEIEPLQLAMAQERWDDAMMFLRRILSRPDLSSRLYPADGDEASSRYVSLETYVFDALLPAMPPDVQERFRAELDLMVGRAIREARAGDVSMLRQIRRRLPLSGRATEGALLLGDAAWEEGRFAQASHFWALAGEEAAGRAAAGSERLFLSRAIVGDESASGTLGGVPIAPGRLADLLSGARSRRAVWSTDGWPAFGGDETGARVAPAVPRTAYLHLVGSGSIKSVFAGARPHVVKSMRRQQQGGETILPIHATVLDGRVYFSGDGANYYAYDAETGKLKGRNSDIAPPRPRNPYYAQQRLLGERFHVITLSAEGVYVVAPLKIPEATGFAPSVPQAYDPTTDKLLRQFRYADGAAPLALLGAPVVWKRTLLCAGVDDKDSLYAVCFDRFSGRELWRTFLCYRSATDNRGMYTDPVPAFLAVDRETLYAATNRGALVSVDLATGHRNWAVRYPLPEAPSGQPVAVFAGGSGMPRACWRPNPLIALDGQIVVAPMDADHLRAYDGRTGEMVWEWKPSPAEQGDPMQYLLGPVDGKLFMLGMRKGFVLEWRGGKRVGEMMLPPGGCRGRPALTADALYVLSWELPGVGGIYRIDLDTLKIADRLLDWNDAGDGMDWANLTLTRDVLVAVSESAFRIYSITSDPETRFRERIASSPEDARAYMSLARYLADQDRLTEAAGVLAEGARRCGGDKAMWTDEGAALCLQAVEEAYVAGRGAQILDLLREADRAFPGLLARPGVRLMLARAAEEAGRPGEAFAAYMEIAKADASAVSIRGVEVFPAAYADHQARRLLGTVSEKALRTAGQEAQARLKALAADPVEKHEEIARCAVWALAGPGGERAAAEALGALGRANRRDAFFDVVTALVHAPEPFAARGAEALRAVAASVPPDWDGAFREAVPALFSTSPEKQSEEPALLWRGGMPEALQSVLPIREAVLTGGRLVVMGCAIAALDVGASEPAWRVEASTGGGIAGARSSVLTVWRGIILACPDDETVCAMDCATGERLWTVREKKGIQGFAVSSSGVVAVLTEGILRFRNGVSGMTVGDAIQFPEADLFTLRWMGASTAVVFGQRGNQRWIRGVRAETGEEVFSISSLPVGLARWGGQQDVTIVGEKILVVAKDAIVVLDPMAPQATWHIPIRSMASAVSLRPSSDGRMLLVRDLVQYARGGSSEVRAYSLETRKALWAAPAGSAFTPHLVDSGPWVFYDHPPDDLRDQEGEVIARRRRLFRHAPDPDDLRDQEGEVIAVDKETGKRVGAFEIPFWRPGGQVARFVAGRGGVVLAVFSTGEFFAFGAAPLGR